MKKVLITKGALAEEVVDKILNVDDPDVVLVIPKGSALKESDGSFATIRDEAGASGRHVYVESVDEEVLKLARQAGIDGTHPLLGSNKKPLSDIVAIPLRRTKKKAEEPVSVPPAELPQAIETPTAASLAEPAPTVRLPHQEEVEGEHADIPGARPEPQATIPPALEQAAREQAARPFFVSIPREAHSEEPVGSDPTRRRKILKLAFGAVVILLLAAGGAWLVAHFYGWSEITVTFAKTPWQKQFVLTADKAVGKVDQANLVVPAELLSDQKNTTQPFPATDKKTVVAKATGKLTVVNNFSAAPQALVATTRFQTADGKIFRLVRSITVPGATIKAGKVTAMASVNADVIADQAGPDYNLSSSDHLTIPGFKGTPKFNGFYGTNLDTSGGSSAGAPVAGSADIDAAKQKMQDILKMSLNSSVWSGDKESMFKLLPEAAEVAITKLVVNSAVDDKGNFNVFGAGSYRALVFREDDVRQLVQALAAKDLAQAPIPNLELQDLKLDYASTTVDYGAGQLHTSVAASGQGAAGFAPDVFKKQLAGQSVSSAKNSAAGIPGISAAKIKVWPSWFWDMPTDPARIRVVVQ